MAEVHPCGTPVGTITADAASRTGLAASTIVATGGHDHGCATLPARVSGEGSILNSTGTTDGIIGVIDAPRLTDEVFELRCRSMGIREFHTSGDFVRAIVEGICYEIRRHIDQYERLFRTSIERIVVVGGTSRSAFWTQLRADVTGRSVEVLDTIEATSLGGAMLVGMAAGIYADYEAAARQVYRLKREFVPDAERHERYERCYRDIYCHLYPSLSGLNAAIARVFPPTE